MNQNATLQNSHEHKAPANSTLQTLEAMMADTCFCKLREKCDDKNSADCLRHKNLYAEAMLSRNHSAP